jgi:threonine dehydratase
MEIWREIELAQSRIRSAIRRTPMVSSDTFSRITGKEIYLKLENLQKAGSFKIRGAYYKLSRLSPSVRKKGIVAASAETMPRESHLPPPFWGSDQPS